MKLVAIVAKDALRTDGAPKAEHLIALDDRGQLWERFSDMDPGEWIEVPGPRKVHVKKASKPSK